MAATTSATVVVLREANACEVVRWTPAQAAKSSPVCSFCTQLGRLELRLASPPSKRAPSLLSLPDPIAPGLVWYPVTFVLYSSEGHMLSLCQQVLQDCLTQLPPSLLNDPALEDVFQLQAGAEDMPASAVPSEDEGDDDNDDADDKDDDDDADDDDETELIDVDEEAAEDDDADDDDDILAE